jgi:hypothetical protein
MAANTGSPLRGNGWAERQDGVVPDLMAGDGGGWLVLNGGERQFAATRQRMGERQDGVVPDLMAGEGGG